MATALGIGLSLVFCQTTNELDLTLSPSSTVYAMVGRTLNHAPFFGGVAPIVSSSTGALPGGVTFANGRYSGTPTTAGTSAGVGGSATDDDGVTVNWSGLSFIVADALEIVQSAPTTAMVGELYESGPISHTGGHGAAQLIIDGLPDGLSVVGDQISGTPTESGAFPFTLRLRDEQGFQSSLDLTLDVVPAPVIEEDFRTLENGGLRLLESGETRALET